MSQILLSQKDAATRLGVSLDQLRMLVDDERLRFVPVGKTKMFAEFELVEFARRETEQCRFIDEKTRAIGSSASIGQTELVSKRRSKSRTTPESETYRPWSAPSERQANQTSVVNYDLVS